MEKEKQTNKDKQKVFLSKLISGIVFALLTAAFIACVALGDTDDKLACCMIVVLLFAALIALIVFLTYVCTSFATYHYFDDKTGEDYIVELYVGTKKARATFKGKQYNMTKIKCGKHDKLFLCVADDDTKIETLVNNSGAVRGLKINGNMATKISK